MKILVVLFLLFAIALSGCNSAASKKDKKDAALKKRAKAELRDPRTQARWLIEAGLRQTGALVVDPPQAGEDDPPHAE